MEKLNFDQSQEDIDNIKAAEDNQVSIFVEKSPKWNGDITSQKELDDLLQNLFGEINPDGRRIDLVKYDLEAENKYFEKEIENLIEEGNPTLNNETIREYKERYLTNSLWIKKIDDFIYDRQMKPSEN